MKKYLVLVLLPVVLVFQFCGSTKKAAESTPHTSTAMTFEKDLKPLISSKCSPCHTIGNKLHLDNFAASKETIDDMIARIEKDPTEKGYMPFKKPKLSDSAISVFKKWKADGLIEK